MKTPSPSRFKAAPLSLLAIYGSYLHRCCVTLACLATGLSLASATTLIQDNFSADTQGGAPAGWGYYYPVSSTNQWKVVADPVLSSNNVLSTAALGTTYQQYGLSSSSGSVSGLDLSFDFYAGVAAADSHYWNTNIFLFSSVPSQAAIMKNGYGILLNYNSIQFYSAAAGSGVGTTTALGTSTALTINPNTWNNIEFKWTTNGLLSTLSFYLNGSLVTSLTDSTYTTASVQSLDIKNFLYSGGVSTDALLYDNVLLQTVPEPNVVCLFVAAFVSLSAISRAGKRR